MSATSSMAPVSHRRHIAWGFAVAATLAASVWALNDDGDAAALASPPQARSAALGARADAASPSGADAAVLMLPERTFAPTARRNLFAATVFAPPPMAAVQAAAPPPPPVITLPFTFGGRLVTPAGASVLLNTGAMTQVLALGATLGDFRFEQDSGSQLEFIHVPSGERLVLPIQP